MRHEPTTNVDALLGRLEQVRALARRLVRDASAADDLVHDALTAALARPSLVQGAVSPWLGVTLRNLARDRARASARRATREARAARGERTADTTGAVERAELQRLVVTEVLALEATYRTVVLLHDFDGLSLREVARSVGATVDVVKKRRQRALEALRARLQTRYMGGTTWAVALLPLAAPRGTLRPGFGAPHVLGGALVAAGVGAALALTLDVGGPRSADGAQATAVSAATATEGAFERGTRSAQPAAEALEDVDVASRAPSSPETETESETETETGPEAQSAPAAEGAAAARPPQAEELPELVYISGGRTRVGSTRREIEALLETQPSLLRVLDAQTPQRFVEVPAFWIGKYEVTNAEYLLFVQATGRRAPLHWANEEAMASAAKAFASAEQGRFAAAKAEGRAYEKRPWSLDGGESPRDAWWAEHWRDAGYAVPAGMERCPVVMVTYADAEAYCAWVGMRLPTEFEVQCAARGASERAYPWGDQWQDGEYCASAEQRSKRPSPVGSFRKGVSPFGVYDLAGNVWEWTSSPYTAYEGFTPGQYRVRINGALEERSVLPAFDADQRVAMGGAFENDKLAARCATRRGIERTRSASGLGFRVATSVAPVVPVVPGPPMAPANPLAPGGAEAPGK
ncbi:MAG: sigma-70 family RNA polymerase sigma factor [Planctomycetota bacterium]